MAESRARLEEHFLKNVYQFSFLCCSFATALYKGKLISQIYSCARIN
jgi:hypothetical protein